ncbi:MAG: hypothetical protein CO003_00945 [Candidatus Portnoybacteria bacterium CG_4_8_14_3_um_filter_44_15]|uniref:PrgI family protein n=4 Tax=Candidatus Portnoyibacteriota TaxID=1817913 RepID=A0A2M7YLE0_9BACT|nr:MAG: hypothetical protein CO003_00945 [Candidatus Portnoybacteria bacterium CG_4_8_14_3_um_filter_44_15]PJA63790.1 MAG: hypothetical protein CO160_01940 [Candidatus Portnoybacteria bacterium CG_4_9_14_3_um_filter_43_11]PJE59366.1 MAG: hypothetical protein COU84_01265 [Candidatus Portnoybacteria bacterium CG10_big_fil_rev_8_21_14_0_10_43_39]
MEFKVPQFIELEDKIVGPLTLKQFLFLGAGGILLFVLWFFLTLGAFIIALIPVAVLSVALAFYKPRGRPSFEMIVLFINYILKPRLYLWKKKNGQQH